MTRGLQQLVFVLVLPFTTVCSLLATDIPKNDANPRLINPVGALVNLPGEAREIMFSKGQTAFLDGGHFQGIQAYRDLTLNKHVCFVSSDSRTKGYFITVAFDLNSQNPGTIGYLQELPSDNRQPPLRHAGGMQRIGNYLVIGVEDNQDKLRSQVQFWDVSDPFAPKMRAPLTIDRESDIAKHKTAGAVGIVRRANDHLVVVANWDANALDFYVSNGLPLGDDACRFKLVSRWTAANAERANWTPDESWESYQNVNLACDRSCAVFLYGLATTSAGNDTIDVYSIDLIKEKRDRVRKLGRKLFAFNSAARFRNGGGLSIESATTLRCYATARNASDKTVICVSP